MESKLLWPKYSPVKLKNANRLRLYPDDMSLLYNLGSFVSRETKLSGLPVLKSQIRCFRKPRWLPVAPSKLYRVPVKKPLPEEERIEYYRLFCNYRTQMRAIRRYLSDLKQKKNLTLSNASSAQSMQEEERELDECFALNDLWNKQVAQEREQHLINRRKAHTDRIMKYIDETDLKRMEELKMAQETIKYSSEISKTFITRETLDEAIENCFKTTANYNYAIDLQGNIIKDEVAKDEAKELEAR